jgi:hypothetical protein
LNFKSKLTSSFFSFFFNKTSLKLTMIIDDGCKLTRRAQVGMS